jgi:hypothetical protein
MRRNRQNVALGEKESYNRITDPLHFVRYIYSPDDQFLSSSNTSQPLTHNPDLYAEADRKSTLNVNEVLGNIFIFFFTGYGTNDNTLIFLIVCRPARSTASH